MLFSVKTVIFEILSEVSIYFKSDERKTKTAFMSPHGNSSKHSLSLDLHDPISFYSHYQPEIKHLYMISTVAEDH